MQHRVQRLIESIFTEGSCPRLQIDLTREGVVCPDFVREKWGERLVIDLDPSYPLNLEFTATGVEVDLSFGGYVTRCTFPHAAIYLVADRATGKGVFLDESAPAAVLRERGFTRSAAQEPGPQPTLRERAAGESRRRRRPKTEEDAPEVVPAEPRRIGLVAVAAAPTEAPAAEPAAEPAAPVAEPAKPEAAEARPPEATEPAPARRRPVFTVIDGGK